MKKLFLFSLLAMALFAGPLAAQSFLKKYTGLGDQRDVSPPFTYPNGDIGMVVQHSWQNNVLLQLRTDADGNLLSNTPVNLPDLYQHYLMPDGSLISAIGFGDYLQVWKRDASGNVLWQNLYPLITLGEVLVYRGMTVSPTNDIFIRGYYYLDGVPHYQNFVVKLSADGDFEWINTVVTNDYDAQISVNADPLGGCLVGWAIIDTASSPAPNIFEGLWRYNADGSTAWSIKAPGDLGQNNVSNGYATNAAGQTLVISTDDQQWIMDSLYWMLLDPAGDTLWQFTSTAHPELKWLRPDVVIPVGNSGFVVAGNFENHPQNQYIGTLAKVDLSGNIEWVRTFGPLSSPQVGIAYFQSGTALNDGSVLVAGTLYDDIFLLKVPADGAFYGYQNTIEGQVAYDTDGNCNIDPTDIPQAFWAVTAEGNGYRQYGLTDAAGHYHIPYLDTGYYQIILTPPSYLWDACQDTIQVYYPYSTTPLTDTADFAAQTPAYCPLLEVQVTVPNWRICTERSVMALVCNQGTAPAAPMQLSVVLDPLLDMAGSPYPYTVQGDTVFFELDTLLPFQCKNFSFQVHVSCDAQLGQTLCLKAQVTPDSLCLFPPDWSGANIVVNGVCEGDSVRFNIKNTGGAPMSEALDFVIIDDHVITRTGAFDLAPEEMHVETVPADGSTWRITARQEPGHPFGSQTPSVAVEGCTDNSWFSTGMVNLFASYTGGAPFEDVECREVVGSYDPNDKAGLPIGLHYEHCVEATEVLDYLVRFQNTGTDTAFYVEIQDTLSAWLNPASIQSVTASHNFRWTLSGAGIIRFIFDDIVLPDSNASQEASQGFVRFRVAQRPGNPVGAQIFNRAGIYFDQNAVVLTNTVFHTVCQDFIEIQVSDVLSPVAAAPGFALFPNPARAEVSVRFDPGAPLGGSIRLLDVFGRVVEQQAVVSTGLSLRRDGLPSGLYFVEWVAPDGRRLVRTLVLE
ncbi:MAG: T9SS type A sorting domain-containing protein [Saprospiraceae bacterium]|nr:T9SS type A sorting domain-containing protein [Saprospiraceae bacterium]